MKTSSTTNHTEASRRDDLNPAAVSIALRTLALTSLVLAGIGAVMWR